MYLPTRPIFSGMRVLDAVDERAPFGEVGLGRALGQTELLDDDPAEAGLFEHERHGVDRPRVGLGDHVVELHVAEQRDLLAELVVDRLVGARDDHVGLDADGAELPHRVLGRLRLELAGRDAGKQREVHVEHVLAADVVAELADRLEVGERFDVADRAADLDDDDLGLLLARDAVDAFLDLIRDVGDDLHRRAEVVAAPFLCDDRVVDLAGREVRGARDVAVDEALVMAEVQVGLGAVLGDEDLAVLIRRHRPGVDVEVGIHLQRGDGETAGREDATERSGGDAFAQ